MKRVTDLIVAKDVSSSDGFIDIVDPGATALVGGETIADDPIIHIRQEIANSVTRLSLPIRGASVKKYSGQSYTAPTVQVTTIDPVSVSNSTTYLMRLSITSQDQVDPVRQSFEVETDASATTTELVTLLKAKINDAALNLPITATGTTTLILTSDAPDDVVNHSVPLDVSAVRFTIGLDDGWASTATNVLTTSPDPGVGSFNQVRMLEFETKGYNGHLNRVMFADTPTFYTISGATYDIYVIEHNSPTELENQVNERILITYILVIAGSSTFSQGGFETILNTWMASTPGSFNAVNL